MGSSPLQPCSGQGVEAPDGPDARDRAETVSRLRAAGCVFAEQEADLLHAAAASGEGLEALIGRRVAGEPLELVLGWAEFGGRRILTAPRVFVPRRRTELLLDHSLQRLPQGGALLDLCCGTGALGAVVAARSPDARVHCADLDPAATRCAASNLAAVGAAVTGRVHTGDLFVALPQGLRFDVIAANTPYVPSDMIAMLPPEARDHEPRPALDGGTDGLDIARRVIDGARAVLRPGGWVLIECTPQQAETLTVHAKARGFGEVVARGADVSPSGSTELSDDESPYAGTVTFEARR